jgi:hypothetical protein
LKATFDSVYPDFLRTGLGRLTQVEARRDLLALFAALEHFRHDLHGQDSVAGILEVSGHYIEGLSLFRSMGFWLACPSDFSFELNLARPATEGPALQATIDQMIKAKRFAFALRQSTPVFFQAGDANAPENGVLHSMALSSQVVGMFCGLLQTGTAPVQEIPFSLLSVLLGASSDALGTLRKTKQLASEVETLTSLLPLCAWCKSVRKDDGYWEQIEKYITSSSSGTSITHGICPDCHKKLMQGVSA